MKEEHLEMRRAAAKYTAAHNRELMAIRREERKRGLPYKVYTGEMCYEALPPERIMGAKKKPAGCSDVRWRIELSRRRLAKKFPARYKCLGFLPDPDKLT